MEKPVMTTPLVTIPNRHVPQCGHPPDFDYDDCKYVSYFEGKYRDQWLFVVKDGTPLVYGGDVGWEKPVRPVEIQGMVLPICTFSRAEKLWVNACWACSKDFRTTENPLPTSEQLAQDLRYGASLGLITEDDLPKQVDA